MITDVIGQQNYIENNRTKNNEKDIRVDDLTGQSSLDYIEFDFCRLDQVGWSSSYILEKE